MLASGEGRELLVTRLFSSDDGSSVISFEGLAGPRCYRCFSVPAGCRSSSEEWMRAQD